MCATGSTKSYRVKINIIGYTKAGKSTLILRLLGKPFQNLESTEGIQIQLIHTTFDATHEVLGPWEEVQLETGKIVKRFNEQMLAKSQNLSKTTAVTVQEAGTPKLNPDEITGQSAIHVKSSSMPEGSSSGIKFSKNLQHETLQQVASLEPSEKSQSEKQSELSEEIKMDPRTFREVKKLKDMYETREDRQECMINLWDHGGQLEFLATHHLFLDADAVNLIVMDITKKLHEEITSKHQKANTEGIPKSGAQFLDYWMQMILEKSVSKGINPNVAIILTHLDQVTTSEADDYISDLINYVKDKPYSKYIDEKNIFQVDNKTDSISEFNQLRKDIFQMATQQKTWGIERPTKWLKLEASIHEEAKAKSSRHIQITRVQELATGFGINKEEVDHFLHFHNSMGDLVHYPDKELKDLIITDPQWLVDMFKALITADEFLEKRRINRSMLEEYKQTALLSKSTLQVLWKGNDVKFLTELMTKFQLVVPLTNSTRDYLAPCMLPPRQLKVYQTEPFKSMMMIYSSPPMKRRSGSDKEFLPVGSYHRFLAALCSSTNWKLCINDHLTYSDASFEVEYGVRVALTLFAKIRVTVWSGGPSFKEAAQRILPNIRDHISRNLKNMGLPEDNNFLILCPHHQSLTTTTPCLVQVAASGSAFIPRNETCFQHDCRLHQDDFAWLQKLVSLAHSSVARNFPSLQFLTKGTAFCI